jgi:hypothetical protein
MVYTAQKNTPNATAMIAGPKDVAKTGKRKDKGTNHRARKPVRIVNARRRGGWNATPAWIW